jgi:lipopolysaccharide/colanic/teichoic acid biosynthesis glycosyltransferase
MLKKERFFVFMMDIIVLLFFVLYLKISGQIGAIKHFLLYLSLLLLIYTSLRGFDLSRAPSPRWTMTSVSISLFLSLVLNTLIALVFNYTLQMDVWGILLYYVMIITFFNPFLFRVMLKRKKIILKIPNNISNEIINRLKGNVYVTVEVQKDKNEKRDRKFYTQLNRILGEIPEEIYSQMDKKIFDEAVRAKKGQMRIIRFLDIVFSLLFISFLLPFYAICSLLILIFQGKPVIFKQTRKGINGKDFTLYKFRTLKAGESKTTNIEQDHLNRSTSIGKFLRSLRLDEVPQFFNCLKGDMSLVGPRPEMLFFHKMGVDNIPNYEKRLLVRPGITGWAQTMYKRSDTLEEYRIKTGYDLSFILDYSISAYFKSLLYTVDTLIYRKG